MKMLSGQKTKSLKCSKQALGTLGKVIEMIENDRYCPEVIQQVDSVIGLLKTTKRELLAGHLDSCVAHKMKENKKQAIEELLKIYNLSN
jgi:DNA-binding FrmR family transcriptional regulator